MILEIAATETMTDLVGASERIKTFRGTGKSSEGPSFVEFSEPVAWPSAAADSLTTVVGEKSELH